MNARKIRLATQRMLKPYRIPPSNPYLSIDQMELSRLTLKGRAQWMAEWLRMAGRSGILKTARKRQRS